MSISALKEDGTRVIGMLMNDSEWQEIEKLSKSRRLLMPQSTKVAIAKTRRGKLITRYFSHLPGEGDCARNNQGSIESIHHLHWKLEIYKALKEEGYDVMIECGNKAWVADVLVRFGDLRNPIAIEIQHSKQSAQETINRIASFSLGLRKA
ncbi:competence protein CoiA family protein [Marinomonas sp. TI.3.20]|uniref:competence protein CoiA family protein n=1 Tax=Marinomonas sp. TI.3.20 TaxID=3121296 RepID=UPI00311E83EC